MGLLGGTGVKKESKFKKAAKHLGALFVMSIMKMLPLIIAISVLITVVDRVIEFFTAVTTPNAIYEMLDLKDSQNVLDLVETKENDAGEYYWDFKEGINDKVEKLVKKINSQAGLHNLPKSSAFIKKIIKAEIITQIPDLGGEVPEDSTGFQGAVKIRRVTPNKEIGEMKNTGKGETSVIEPETTNDPVGSEDEYNEEVSRWLEGQLLVISHNAYIYDQTKSQLDPSKETNNWQARYQEGTLNKITLKVGKEVTYTGTYKTSMNSLTQKVTTYVEIKTEDLTGYVKLGNVKTKQEDSSSEQKTSKIANKQVTSRDKTTKKTAADATKEYVIAIAAGHNNTDDTGASSGDLIEQDLTVKVAEKIEELLKEYSNVKVIQTGSTSANRGGVKVGERKSLARAANPDLCIQVHFNAGGGTGVEAIYKDGDGISQQLAEILSKTMASSMGLPNRQAGPDVEKCAIKSLGIIENAATSGFPSVVTEGGFVDGSPDAEILRNGGVEKCAKGIADGIVEYLGADHTGYSSVANGSQTVTESVESIVRNMKYIDPQEMKDLIESGNKDVLKYYTLDENKKLITVSWSQKEDGSIEFKENAAINTAGVLQKYVMPYEYLLYYYIDTDYKKFSEDLAQKVLESELVIAVQDQVTTTKQVDTTQSKTEASVEGYGKDWTNTKSSTKVTEICSTRIEPTYIDTWCVKSYYENSYSTATLNMGDSDEKILEIKGTVTENSSNSTTGEYITEEGTASTNKKDENGNDIMYSYKNYERVNTNISTIANKYEKGEMTTKGQENKFVKLYQEDKMYNRVRPERLFKIIENNNKTVGLLDLTKYLIYLATGEDFGVYEFDFSIYDLKDFSTISASSGGISLTTTMFTREIFIEALTTYGAKSGNANFNANFLPYAGEIYDVSVASGINPELVVVTAKTEQNFKAGGGSYNYWGIGVTNGSNSGRSFASLADGIRGYAGVISSYGPDGKWAAQITEIYEQRKASGCDPLGYGLPGTFSGMQSIYSNLGKHEYGSSGAGGYYYMDPARAGVTRIYATHEDFVNNCLNAGGEHASGTPTTPWEQGQYTAYQVQDKIDVWNEIFGEYGTLSGGGEFLQTAKEVWMQVCTSGKYTSYAGSSIPCPGPTIDCSSFVSWVIYEYGYTEFAGWQKTTGVFMNTNWNEKYGWEEISVAGGENPADKLKPGDIFVREGAGTHHVTLVVEVKDGRLYAYDCGSTSAKWNGTDGSPLDQTYFLSVGAPGKIIRVTPPK